MGWGTRSIKSEHNGAKNGGGHWGLRIEAKYVSKKGRRGQDVRLAREGLACFHKKAASGTGPRHTQERGSG